MIRAQKGGFALPTILIASFVMLVVLVAAIQSVVSISVSLQSQHINQLAKEAADSGIAMARACLKENDNTVTWTGKTLRPWTNCSGDIVNASWPCASGGTTDERCWVTLQDTLRSTFTVPVPTTAADGKTRQITSTAQVDQVRTSSGASWRTTSATSRAQAGSLNVVHTSAGRQFACSLLDNAQLYCWGYNVQGAMGPAVASDSSAPSRVDTASAFSGKVISSIPDGSFGASHMCAVAGGEAYCWGSNTYGQLGNGSGNGIFTMSSEPVKVANGTGEVMNGRTVTEVAIGDSGSCAVATGRVFCWGDNTYGQLGNGSAAAYSSKPVAVSGIPMTSTVTDISYHQNTACAIASGKLYCWGWNQWNQIGNNSSANQTTALEVGGLLAGKTVSAVQTGHATTCAIANSEVYCWGIGGNGALGTGTNSSSAVPVKVANGAGSSLNGKTPVQLSSGFHFNCARTSDGRVSCWGLNGAEGNLGRGAFGGESYTPAEVANLSTLGTVTDLTSSRGQSCIVANASTYCWGSVYDGQVRFGVNTPAAVSTTGALNAKTITNITTGGPTACASSSDGIVACWGSNNNGTIGDNTNNNTLVPVAVNTSSGFTGKTITDLSMGDGTVCALASGEYWCWGQNTAGKAGDGTMGDKRIPNRVPSTGLLAGRTLQHITSSISGVVCGIASGAPFCWGGYASAPRATSLGNGTIVQANGGYYTTTPVAVTQESGVLSGKTATEITSGQPLCVIANGTPYCWGENAMGQLGNNISDAGSSKPVAVFSESGVLAGKTATKIASGRFYGCVATSEPNVYCWGYNFDGQYGNVDRDTSFKPVLVTTVTNPLKGKTIAKLTAGGSHACALTSEGQLYCWGYNALGQVGDGSNTNRYAPVLIQGQLAGKTVTDVSATDNATCAIATGKAYCWGNNDYGQVGNGTSQVSATPSPTRSLRIPPLLQY